MENMSGYKLTVNITFESNISSLIMEEKE